MTNSRAISTFSTGSLSETDIRCSIIVPAGDDLSMLNNYLLFLNQAQLPCNYEIVIANDRGLHIDEKLLDVFSPAVRVLNLDTKLIQEQLFNKSAIAARGKFLLFIREFVKFDKLVLEESIRELDASEDKISVSEKGSFLLVESSFYMSNEIIMQIIKETDENTSLDQIVGLLRASRLAAQWTPQDQRMLDFYSQFISFGYVCFDVGANVGNRTKIFLKLGAKVVAVEPQDDCVRCLKVTYGRNDNFRIIQKVLGESQGHAELMVCNANTISSMSREWIDSVKKSGRFRNYSWDKTQTVSMTTLDQLIEEYGIPAFTKIDVEGFEYEVLKGLSQPLKVLSLEFTPEFSTSTFKCIEHLQSLGRIQLNYSLGETMQLVLDKWINPKAMIETLKNLRYDNKTFGDVYVKFLNRTSKNKISVSANGNFLPVESSSYLPKTSLDGGGERVDIFYGDDLVFDSLDMYQKSHYRRYDFAKSVTSPGKIIGDFACGTGYGSVMLSENAKLVIGADIDKNVIEQIRRRYAGVKNTEFVCSNLLNLTYQSFFDCIVAFETIEHLREADIPSLFAIFARALKPGGMLIFSTPYKQPKSPEAVNMGFHQTFDIDEEKIRRWLSENGLVPECFKYQNYQTHDIEDHLSRKDFIICLARTCKDSVIKEHVPKVSILIPTFNRANYLKMAIDSAIAQTYPNTEVLVLDDCSTDETVNLSRTYRNATNVKFIRNETNIGFIDNWNKAVSLSSGEYIKIMGDDDILSPECVAEQARILDEHPDVGVVCCNLSVIDEDSRLKNGNNPYKLFSRDMKENGREFIKNYLLGKRAVGWPTAILFRRRDIDEAGYFDIEAGCAADIDMWCRILRVKDFYYLDKMLAYNRQFPGNLSRKLQANDFGYKDILYFYFKMVPCVEHILDEHTNRQIWSTLITKILPFYSKAEAQNKTVIKRDIDSLMVRQAHHPEQTCPERGRESRGTERCCPGRTHSPGPRVLLSQDSSGGKNTTALIFSKDRAMQLQATIESFILQCWDSDAADIVVLFKASGAVHHREYDELKEKFPAVTFVEETDFRQQVLSVVERCKYVLFLVDDNIFVKPFLLRDVIAALDSEKNAIGFSLRLGKNTSYCYMLSSQQKLPAFECVREGILRYYWPGAECDFGYPLEVSSSIYRSNEILHLLNQLKFSNPNTLENEMNHNRNTFVSAAPVLLTFEESITFCNPVNVVQHVYENNKFGTIHSYTSERLADCFSRGMVIDVRKYVGFTPNSAHQEVELYFKPAERVDKGSIEISRKIHSLYERYAVGRLYGTPYISIAPLYKAHGNPLVSVWMAAYNAADYIARAIESVLIQNYRNFELIVVDDGSTDRTADIVRSFEGEPIKYFFKEHGGLASVRNFQIRKSSGSFIVILDSDDMMMPDYIARHLQVFEQHPETDLVYCDDLLIGEDDKPIRIMNRTEYPDPKAFLSRLFRSGWAIVPFKNCIRKSVFDKIGFYDERLIVSEDHDMLMRFVAHGLKMRHLPAVLTLRYLTANSLSRSFDAAKAKSHFEVVRRFTEMFTPEELFPDVRWDKLSAEQKLLLAKCKTAVVYIGIGEQYLGSNAPFFAEAAFEMACEQLEECCKIEPANPQVRYLLEKCRLIRATHLPSEQLADCFSRGMARDVRKYVGFTPNSAHQEVELYFKPADRVISDAQATETDREHQGKTLKPKFSIVMANYNNGRYIGQAIESVLSQTFKDWELIIVDDCSTDDSVDIIKRYLADDRIHLIRHDANKGYVAALKTAIAAVQSELFGILDSDDCLTAHAVETMYQHHIHSPDCGLIYSQFMHCDQNLMPKHPGLCRAIPPGVTTLDVHVVSHFKTFKLRDYLKTAGYDESILYAEDRDIVYKMEEVTRFKFIDDCLYLYRNLPHSVSHDAHKAAVGRGSMERAKMAAIKRRFLKAEKAGGTGFQPAKTRPRWPCHRRATDSASSFILRSSPATENGNPLVSVWMAAYNAADYIARAIESVLMQNYHNIELIVVDDGSTDQTADIVSGFKDEAIKYFFKEHGGLASARNFQLKKSSGSFIVILDSDDMMMPDFIARHLQVFEQHPEMDLVYCDDCLIDEQDEPIRVIDRPEYLDRKCLIRDLFRCGFPVVPFRTCIRKSVFDKIGLFDEKLLVAEDYDMIRRFVKNGLKAHHLKGALYLRRMTSHSHSANSTIQKAKSHFEVFKRFADTFACEELFPDIAWDKIVSHRRQLYVKCLTAVTCLSIGQSYVESNSPVCAKTAFGQAYSDLKDCLEMEPDNRLFQQLLHKFELLHTEYAPEMQQSAR